MTIGTLEFTKFLAGGFDTDAFPATEKERAGVRPTHAISSADIDCRVAVIGRQQLSYVFRENSIFVETRKFSFSLQRQPGVMEPAVEASKQLRSFFLFTQ